MDRVEELLCQLGHSASAVFEDHQQTTFNGVPGCAICIGKSSAFQNLRLFSQELSALRTFLLFRLFFQDLTKIPIFGQKSFDVGIQLSSM